MIEIKLEKRYPLSRVEDITDAFMRGYEEGRKAESIWREKVEAAFADRNTENSSEKPNNCEDCEHWNDTEDGCADRHGCKDEPQTKLCRECDGYAGDGMYCASNHIVYDFSTSKGNCEPQTERSE